MKLKEIIAALTPGDWILSRAAEIRHRTATVNSGMETACPLAFLAQTTTNSHFFAMRQKLGISERQQSVFIKAADNSQIKLRERSRRIVRCELLKHLNLTEPERRTP